MYSALFDNSVFGQSEYQARIDSLLNALPEQKENTGKVNILNSLSDINTAINPDEGIQFGNRGLALAIKLGWQRGIADANNNIALNYITKSEYDSALVYASTALEILTELDDKIATAGATGNIGLIYQNKGDYANASKYYRKSLELNEKIGDKRGIATSSVNIGIVCYFQGDYPAALKYCFKALKNDEHGGDPQAIGRDLANVGNIYYVMRDVPNALKYFNRALKFSEDLGDKRTVSGITSNIGVIYMEEGEYENALDFIKKSLKLSEEIGDVQGMLVCYSNMGLICHDKKDYSLALAYNELALKLARKIGHKSQVAFNLTAIGNLFLSYSEDTSIASRYSGSVDEYLESQLPGSSGELKILPSGKTAQVRGAISYLEQALRVAHEINEPEQLKACYESLAKAYKQVSLYKKALAASDNYWAIKDSLFSIEKKEEILKLSLQNEYERQRLADSMKTAEKQKIASIYLKKQKSYTSLGIAGMILLAGFSFFIVKERSKSEKERKKSDELLLNILPEAVAAELKITGEIAAKHYDNVTVLFTDFVNFTQASQSMGPQNLIEELHTCFQAFDEIVTRHGVEKIKTIGDAYLAVGGLPTADANHAKNVVSAAIEIADYMDRRLARLGVERTFQLRIGIHSGSVVAGIVGVKKFAYDIWGDTVNTAARMEQNSEAGRINISQTTYTLVKGDFNCYFRGELEVKNKGAMKMYYVSV